MKLFDLTSIYQNLLDLIEDGEDFEAALGEIEGEIKDKAENYAFVIKTLEAEGTAFKTTADGLLAKASARNNAADRLKAHLKAGLEAANIDTVKGTIYTIALQNSLPSVEVVDMAKVPLAWQRGTVTVPILELPNGLWKQASVVVDKKMALEAWKEGDVGDGIVIKQDKHLRIR